MAKATPEQTQYIVDNGPFLTLAELRNDTDLSDFKIHSILEEHGMKALSVRQQRKNYIVAHKHWTPERLSKVMKMGIYYVKELANEADVILDDGEGEEVWTLQKSLDTVKFCLKY